MMNKTTDAILCAICAPFLLLLLQDVVADDNGVGDPALRPRHLIGGMTGHLNLFQQSTVEDEEVSSAQHLRGHNIEKPPSPATPLNLFKQSRIVNGDTVEGGNAAYPFQVQLGWGFCGGQLIAPDVVLTASHCVEDGAPSTVSIWNGNRMQARSVKNYQMHPDYDDRDLFNDLALIKLKAPALDVNVVDNGEWSHWELVNSYDWEERPPIIRMQRYQRPSGCTSFSEDQAKDITTLFVIGHGTTSSGGSMAGELLEADVHYVLNSVCDEQYYSSGWITDDMICASDISENQDACQGDSGGPLFTRLPVGDHQLFTLVGVTSWGIGCADEDFPGVSSRVAANEDWIDGTVCGSMSRLSCTADGKIRDYAVESLTSGTSVSRRRTKEDVFRNNDRTLAALYGEKWKEEVCELLGGDVNEETPAPSSSSPTTTSSPSNAPIISPSMEPSVTHSQMPSSLPSDSPSLPPGKSPTKKFSNKDKNAKEKGKGVMFQMQADTGDVVVQKISFQTKDDKDTEVQVYFQLGSYGEMPDGGMDASSWGEAVFDGIPESTSNGLREAVLDNVLLTIPKGSIASFYLSGKKEFMFEEGDQEFAESDNSGDFKIFTGSAWKKPFQQRLMNANFVGELTYYTYIEATKVTDTPSMMPSRVTAAPSTVPSTSTVPTLPPNEDTTSPSISASDSPSLPPSENDDGGSGGADTPKTYTTPGADKAKDNAKGVMFTITAESKDVSITGIGIRGKDAKESDVWIYSHDGLYDDFNALDEGNWNEVFDGKVMLDPEEITVVDLSEEITIPARGTVSFYVVSKKGVLFTKASDGEFDIFAANNDFVVRVGTTTKKEFQQFDKLANFAGRIVYQT